MNISINIGDYLTEDEIRELIRAELKEAVQKDAERILSNTAYHVVWQAVDAALDGESKEAIKKKVLEIIGKMTDYAVFKRPDVWDEKTNSAYEEMKAAIAENKDLIHQKVKEVIEAHDYAQDLNRDSEYFADVLIEALKKGLK